MLDIGMESFSIVDFGLDHRFIISRTCLGMSEIKNVWMKDASRTEQVL